MKSVMKAPKISAVVRVYNGEQYVGETLTAILSQTRPADEVLVVDDGSTDGTRDILGGFGREIRTIAQSNSGRTAAMNTAYSRARFAYIANCDADDLWEPDKLARQAEAVGAHPGIDIAFGRARSFGLYEGNWVPLSRTGVVGAAELARSLYRCNLICASSTLISRRLYERLGPFDLWLSEDYDYWLRAIRAGAVFYYDPTVLVHHREHNGAATRESLAIQQATHVVHERYADVVDRRLAREVLACDLNKIGRLLVQEEIQGSAREAFRASMRRKPTAFASAWLVLLAAPSRYRTAMIARSVSFRRWLTRRLHGSVAA